jgi:SET domain-containing protein
MKKLVVGRSPTLNIRGVLAAEPIRKDEVIEISPVVILPGHQLNAEFDQDYANHTIVFVAVKDIQPGEEILINYNGAADDATPVEWLVSKR